MKELKGKDLLNKIAELTKIDAAALETALSDDAEKGVAVPELVVYKTDDFETYKKNLIDSSRDGIVKVAVKKYAQENGIEIPESKRDFSGFAEVLKSKIETDLKIKPDEQIKKLRSEFETKLTEYEQRVETEKQRAESLGEQLFTYKTKGESLRKIKSETKIEPDLIFDLFTLNEAVPVKTESGIIGAKSKKTGEIIKDDRLNPVPFADVFAQYTDKNFAVKGGAGSGGSGSGGSKTKDGVLIFGSHSDWAEHWGEDSGSPDAVKSLAESIKKPNFKY